MAHLNTHRKLALLMLACALLLLIGIASAALASNASAPDLPNPQNAPATALTDYNPLDDPLVMAEIAREIMKDYDPTTGVYQHLLDNLVTDGMQLKVDYDAAAFKAKEWREFQIAHGHPVNSTGSLSLLLGGVGLIGGALYFRWRRKRKPRKPIWALRGKK